MIRIGSGKPRASKGIKYSDGRWRSWSTNEWGYISLDMWGKIQYFQEDTLNFHPDSVWGIMMRTDPKFLEGQIKRKLEMCPSKSCVWEFDAFTSNFKDRLRFVAMLENDKNSPEFSLRPWTITEAYVKLPLLKAYCWFRNKIMKIEHKIRYK